MSDLLDKNAAFYTKSGYARHRGFSPAYVTKLKNLGKLVLVRRGGKEVVNVAATDKLLADAADPMKGKNGAPAVAAPVNGNVAATDVDAETYKKHRAAREAADAALKQLKLGEAQGLLISRVAAEAAMFSAMRTIRDQMASAASLIADRVSTLETKIQRVTVITEEMNKALTQAADDLARDGFEAAVPSEGDQG